mmetsp:Transcript_41135/g.90310  ORF Transcript_41135/g.90310 Transcript_41135/m.90310 type:complete len:250 (+) Transcript_41135:1174-1923(+)
MPPSRSCTSRFCSCATATGSAPASSPRLRTPLKSTCSPRTTNMAASTCCQLGAPRPSRSDATNSLCRSCMHVPSTSIADCSRKRSKSSSCSSSLSSHVVKSAGSVHCLIIIWWRLRYSGCRSCSLRCSNGVSCMLHQKSTVSSAIARSAPSMRIMRVTMASSGPSVAAMMSTARSAKAATTRQTWRARSSTSRRSRDSSSRRSAASWMSCAPSLDAFSSELGHVALSCVFEAENSSINALAAASFSVDS